MLAHLVFALALTATDQTVQVAKGAKLDVNNFAGDVIVKTWDKDAVRVEVNHSDRETVDIKQTDQAVSIRSRSTRGGPPRSLDYTITVPGWMGVNVSGTYADVTLEGVGGEVTVDTTRGDIKVRGGSGFVSLKSVQGEISLEKAKGRVEVRAVNESIHLADINGDLSAESTNGSIILDRIDSGNVDLYTVNGNISYDGPIKDKGIYRLTTHNGMIAVPIADRANLTLSARTYNGSIRSTFALPGDAPERRGKRLSLTLGNGSARLELESFSGAISLRRPGEARPEVERRRVREPRVRIEIEKEEEKAKEKAKEKGDLDQAMQEAMASIPEAIDEALASLPQALDEAFTALRTWPMPVPAPRAIPKPR